MTCFCFILCSWSFHFNLMFMKALIFVLRLTFVPLMLNALSCWINVIHDLNESTCISFTWMWSHECMILACTHHTLWSKFDSFLQFLLSYVNMLRSFKNFRFIDLRLMMSTLKNKYNIDEIQDLCDIFAYYLAHEINWFIKRHFWKTSSFI